MSKQKTTTKKKTTKKKPTKKTLEPVPGPYLELGTKVRDLVTGFEGIAIARVTFLNDCIQYMVKPNQLDKDNKPLDAVPIDYQQLVIVDEGIVPKKINKKKENEDEPTGGIMPDTPVM